MNHRIIKAGSVALTVFSLLTACKKTNTGTNAPAQPKNPDAAQVVSVDRFSSTAGTLQVRTATNGLPGPNQPVNFDQGPFITLALGASNGQKVTYYNFDVQSTTPAPIYVLFRQGESQPVASQLNIIDVLPGIKGYNDFWEVQKVTVPSNYVANSVTSYQEILSNGYTVQATSGLVNCPVVPKGSTASKRFNGGDPTLTRGWYQGQVVYYFNFAEVALTTTSSGTIPEVPLFVTFNINPNQPNGGPASGFETEPGTLQTHNIVPVLPGQNGYTPFWSIDVYDNADFSAVTSLAAANSSSTNILGKGVSNVNCPVVSAQ
jgi:hypothetical protein